MDWLVGWWMVDGATGSRARETPDKMLQSHLLGTGTQEVPEVYNLIGWVLLKQVPQGTRSVETGTRYNKMQENQQLGTWVQEVICRLVELMD